MRKKIILTMAALMVTVALVAGGTMAWFTDTDTAGEAVFTAGTLKLDISDETEPLEIEFPNMNPGDIYDEEPIEIIIENTGTKKLAWLGKWYLGAGSGQKLTEAIYINSAKMEFKAPGSGADWESTDQFITDGRGSGPYPAAFDLIADHSDFEVITLKNWLDRTINTTMTPGFDYQHMGALRPNYSYRLTITFGFHELADNNYQGNVTDPVKLCFDVESTQITAGALDGIDNGLGAWDWWFNDQIAKQPDVTVTPE